VVQSLVWVYAELEWQPFCELMNIFAAEHIGKALANKLEIVSTKLGIL
jgi:hypothetical protein